jgi:hypothetical protein
VVGRKEEGRMEEGRNIKEKVNLYILISYLP